MKLFENRAMYFGQDFDIDMVDGGTSEVCVHAEEDYMIAMAYVADCHTYNREVELDKFDIEVERNKMIDLYLKMINLNK